MKSVFAFLFLFVSGVAIANEKHVNCLKEAMDLGMKMTEAYQTCAVSGKVRECILAEQRKNQAHLHESDLAKAAKRAISNCHAKL